MVKTKIQYEILESKQNRKYVGIDGGILKCIKEIYKDAGFKGFWQGFNSCAIYYMVACSAQLIGYEQSRIFWNTYIAIQTIIYFSVNQYPNLPFIGDYFVYYSKPQEEGCYAKIYKAEQMSTKLSICVKILQITVENQNLIDKEIQILNKLKAMNNPHLIKIYDILNQNSLLFIFMELCKQNLGEYIANIKQKNQLLSLIQIIDIAKQIVDGYRTLYFNHIIHRDLKQKNILHLKKLIFFIITINFINLIIMIYFIINQIQPNIYFIKDHQIKDLY